LGLNRKKFELYDPDLSVIITGNEVNEYFRVLLKAMELVVPEAAGKTKHLGHGMLRLPTGKMSSRTGDVITAEFLIDQVKTAVGDKIKENPEFTPEDKENIKEKVAIAAIRYSILRQSIGKDIIFDINTSIAFHGDSGPYLQYTYARLNKVVSKSSSIAPFYDGPPFATGLPHYGHILASTIKDLIPRYQTMRGSYVRRRWGWDCHGLPIEEIVEREARHFRQEANRGNRHPEIQRDLPRDRAPLRG
jgi:hypothetical protein